MVGSPIQREDGVEVVKVQGIEELITKLKEIPKKMRKRVLRRGLAAGARIVRNDAKRAVPVLSASAAAKAPYRTPGTVRDAIRVRSSKRDKRSGDVGVFVNVKPLKKGLRSAKNPRDPFYWKFIEFGTKKYNAGAGFLRPAASKLGQSLQAFERVMAKWFETTNSTGKVIE